VKYAWIAQRRNYPLTEMYEAQGVSASGYKVWRVGVGPSSTRPSVAQETAPINATDADVKGAYGPRPMHRRLKDRGYGKGILVSMLIRQF
jgi:hypothetical protein